jgi:hypothetical protein
LLCWPFAVKIFGALSFLAAKGNSLKTYRIYGFWCLRARRKRKEESSFCEQKEAKKLYSFSLGVRRRRCPLPETKRTKVFCFFFLKKKHFLPTEPAPH